MSGRISLASREPAQHRPGLAGALAGREVFLFFLFTFVFSWTIYLCLSLARPSEPAVLSRWLLIAAYGPSVVALTLARIMDSQPIAPSSVASRSVLFILTFVPALGIELLDHKWWNHQTSASLIIADVTLVSLAALVASGVLSRNCGVKDLMRGLVQSRVGLGWYFIALFLWPALIVAGNALATVLGMDVPATPPYPAGIPLILLIAEGFVWFLLFGGPLNEEVGWRAFALPRLQRRMSPLAASAIVGANWGLWHVPLHLMGVYPGGAVGALIRIFDIPRAILFTWLFNRTRQSLVPVLLFHAAINATSLFMSRNYVTSSALMLFLAVCVVLLDRMWRSPGQSLTSS
ncbi:MAG: CPBP family intramembrane glutamic endopeptidase [Bacillota bacterium]